jgi:hypothetical protein
MFIPLEGTAGGWPKTFFRSHRRLMDMDPIRLIRDRAELQGTCYFEIMPGKFHGKCWNEGSLFLAEDVFGLARMARELADWVREQLRWNDCISILGM